MILQQCLPQHAISRWISRLSHCRIGWFKRWAIRRYIRQYKVDVSEAAISELEAFENLNAFFTRALKSEARPIDTATNHLVSPADGCIAQIGHCDSSKRCLLVKGQDYSLQKLLLNDRNLCQTFGESCAYFTVYLSPRDYHRVHMPLNGKLKRMWTVPGDLFAVNAKTVNALPDIFTRNERVLCLFDTDFGPMCVILVGAMIVSGIVTQWAGRLTPNHYRQVQIQDYSQQQPSIELKKGEELGYFEFGSTVIVLMANGQQCDWLAARQQQQTIQVGQAIASMTAKQPKERAYESASRTHPQ